MDTLGGGGGFTVWHAIHTILTAGCGKRGGGGEGNYNTWFKYNWQIKDNLSKKNLKG